MDDFCEWNNNGEKRNYAPYEKKQILLEKYPETQTRPKKQI